MKDDEREALRAIEEWCGIRHSRAGMKTTFFIVLGIVIAFLAVTLSGCVQTTTTAKDGSVTTTKAPAPGVLPFAAAAITAWSPREIVVKQQKSGPVREHLQGWQSRSEVAAGSKTGRIAKEEIEHRRR